MRQLPTVATVLSIQSSCTLRQVIASSALMSGNPIFPVKVGNTASPNRLCSSARAVMLRAEKCYILPPIHKKMWLQSLTSGQLVAQVLLAGEIARFALNTIIM